MSIVVTGATGHLGRLAVEALLDRGVPAEEIVATGRHIEKLADLEARGVTVRHADYSDPVTLKEAFGGGEKILFVSSSEVGQRIEQHQNVVDAARDTDVRLLAYTSIANADTATMSLAREHQATEEMIRDSGVPFVLLRNSWYLENYTGQISTALENGVILGAAGMGRVSAAARADYAEAAATVLATDGHDGKVYELGGDEAFTLSRYAALVSELSGTTVAYQDMSENEYAATLAGFGLPQPVAATYANADAGLARGELYVDSGDLSRLIGRPTTPLADAIRAAVGNVRD